MKQEPVVWHLVAVANCAVFVATTSLWILAVYLDVRDGLPPGWSRISNPLAGLLPLMLSLLANSKLMKNEREVCLFIGLAQVGLFLMFVHVFGRAILGWLVTVA